MSSWQQTLMSNADAYSLHEQCNWTMQTRVGLPIWHC